MHKVFLILILHLLASVVAQSSGRPTIIAPADYPPHLTEMVVKAHEQITAELSKKLGFSLCEPVVIVLCEDHEDLERLTGHELPLWVLGIAIPKTHTIAVNSQKIDMVHNNLVAVIKHEMCHLYLGVWERTNRKRLPMWFNEGVCEWYSGGLHLTCAEDVVTSAAEGTLIPLDSLEDSFPEDAEMATLAYSQSLSVVRYIVDTYGEVALSKILSHYAESTTFATAVRKSLGISLPELEARWQQAITPASPWLWRIAKNVSLFSILALLVIVAYWRQRRRSRKILQKWEDEEGDEEELEELEDEETLETWETWKRRWWKERRRWKRRRRP